MKKYYILLLSFFAFSATAAESEAQSLKHSSGKGFGQGMSRELVNLTQPRKYQDAADDSSDGIPAAVHKGDGDWFCEASGEYFYTYPSSSSLSGCTFRFKDKGKSSDWDKERVRDECKWSVLRYLEMTRRRNFEMTRRKNAFLTWQDNVS